MREQEMRTMFDHMDKNHNGYVTPKELKCYLRANNIKVTNKEVKEFFNRYDESGDVTVLLTSKQYEDEYSIAVQRKKIYQHIYSFTKITNALVANLFIIPYVKTFGIQSYHNI
ncbi:calmodulin [Schistosoma japonicum]|nr:calmodulin [Schistosoma japonicum]